MQRLADAGARRGAGDWRRSATLPEPCRDGAVRQCATTLSEHAGILNCFHGVQTCEAGSWSSCRGESQSQQPTPDWYAAGRCRLLSHGTPQSCATNPCDPLCQSYAETPDEPLVADGDEAEFTWQTAAETDPGVELSALASEPCASGRDCQGNRRCENVATAGSC